MDPFEAVDVKFGGCFPSKIWPTSCYGELLLDTVCGKFCLRIPTAEEFFPRRLNIASTSSELNFGIRRSKQIKAQLCGHENLGGGNSNIF